MAIFVQAELEGVTTAQYDALNARLQQLPGNPFEGCLSHAAVPTGSGLRIFDLWESEEHMRRFADTVMPLAAEVGFPEGPMPKMSQVHNFFVPGA
ncbi:MULTISPECIES: hypothetical protein [Streptomyces]|uniref:hypothetical protein n=1 Tax=Streptomyces TaxID=1883 RepID=UPI0013190762|nr:MULTISPECIES: hypothetical protein [Streptomyces]QGZ47325.1 hypothetical protein GPZ77_01910 [Streptomyces sp. QHH-9511]GGT80175.1 hypothetical protein GCM10010272_25550 [Streptomyces lateritius]